MQGESEHGTLAFFFLCAVGNHHFDIAAIYKLLPGDDPDYTTTCPSVTFVFVLFVQQCHSSSGDRGGRQARFVVTCAASPSATRLTCSVTKCSMQRCGMSTFVKSVHGPSLGRVASRDTSATCMPHWPVALECSAAKIRPVHMALSPMWGDISVALTGCVSLLYPAEWWLVEPLRRRVDIECHCMPKHAISASM